MASGLTGFRLIVYVPIEGYCFVFTTKEVSEKI